MRFRQLKTRITADRGEWEEHAGAGEDDRAAQEGRGAHAAGERGSEARRAATAVRRTTQTAADREHSAQGQSAAFEIHSFLPDEFLLSPSSPVLLILVTFELSCV